MKESNLTQARVRELLHYDEDTGYMHWTVTKQGTYVGKIAGTINKRNGYVQITVDGERHQMHRVIFLYMEGVFPHSCVDHKNHIRNDNRWHNLRHATYSQNNCNRSEGNNETPGVCWNKRLKKWHAYSTLDGVRNHLGYYIVYDNAVTARLRWEADVGFTKW